MRPHAQSGLLLAQTAVLLFVVGLLLATLAPLLIQIAQRDAQKDEKARVRAARDEVIGYAALHCRLPNPNPPENWSPGHSQGRLQGERIVYLPHAALLDADLKPNPGKGYDLTRAGASLPLGDKVAFFVLGQGANRRTDLNVAINPVVIPAASIEFDDLIEYATVNYLASLNLKQCAASEYVHGSGGGAQPPLIAPGPDYLGVKYNGAYVNPRTKVNLATGEVTSQSPHDGGAVARLGYNGGVGAVWEQALLIQGGVATGHLAWTDNVAKRFLARYDKAANQILWQVEGLTQTSALPPVPVGYERVLGNFYVISYAKQWSETVTVSKLTVDGALLPPPYDTLIANGATSAYSYMLSQRNLAASSLTVEGEVALSDARAPANDANTGTSVHFLLYDLSPIVIASISPATGTAGTTVVLEGAAFPTLNPSVFYEDAGTGVRQSATILSSTGTRVECLAPVMASGTKARVYLKGTQSYEYSNVAYFTYN